LPRKTHLLLVDDDPNYAGIGFSPRPRFRLAGHEATVCDNAGLAPWNSLRTESFDVILSDVVMARQERLGIARGSEEGPASKNADRAHFPGQANIENGQ